jgi:hypothetical protein
LLNEYPIPSFKLLPKSLSSYLNLLLGYATFSFNYVAYVLPHKYNKAVQIFLYNLVPLFLNYPPHLLLYIRPITTLGNLLLHLLKCFNWIKVRAIYGPIKHSDSAGYELGFGRICCIYSSAVHLYNRWVRIKRLVGVKIRIILPVVVFVEVLLA